MQQFGLQRPIVIGHRGAPGYRPEHTASSYELAFALGADAVEPDLVSTKDGVLVLRHENEISGTTDVAIRPEFSHKRTTKVVDGTELTGWFTEDFTWQELSTLFCRERIPAIRPDSASFDGASRILRLQDLFRIIETASEDQGRQLGVVLEIKHATYFENAGFPLDELIARDLAGTGWSRENGLIVEAFEKSVLGKLKRRGVDAQYVYLIEKRGKPFDLVASLGADAPTYADAITDAGLDALRAGDVSDQVDGISVDKTLLLNRDERGNALGASDLVTRAHARDLAVFTWTLRPENNFLSTNFKAGKKPDELGNWQSEFDLILSTGVDGIFVDQPDLGVSARQRFAGAQGLA